MTRAKIRSRVIATACALLLVSSVTISAALADSRPHPHHKSHHVTHHSSGIPQHNGGDRDGDNNGGPTDGDGNI